MLKKNSIFIKILVPVIAVMLFQTLLISVLLFLNGTISSLRDSAVENMRKNVENRAITLENSMVDKWSNIEKFESDMTAVIDEYLIKNNLSLGGVTGDRGHESAILYNLSDPLINALRFNSATGIYIYFIGGEYTEEKKTFNGIYYRDLDPSSTPPDNSDILFLRGSINIARKDQIQLDSLWSENFTFDPKSEGSWNDYAKPLIAALENPGITPADLSYWNTTHFINPESVMDANECITYTRPFFYEGQLIAMIGTEIQLDHIKKYFSANDFNISDKIGYMLIRYDASDAQLNCGVSAVTGSYIKRLLGSEKTIRLRETAKTDVYTVESWESENVRAVISPLRIYSSNAPFSGEQWALAAIGSEVTLFAPSNKVIAGVLFGSAVALVIGIVLLAFIIRLSTKPLIYIAGQISRSGANDPIIVSDTNIYEIDLLSSTINVMRNKRKLAEEQLMDERERYLIALESAADTFIEYDAGQDCLMIYYFEEENNKSKLFSNVIDSPEQKIISGQICHPEDGRNFIEFLYGRGGTSAEARIDTSLFPHIKNTLPDEGYYWFQIKAKHLRDAAKTIAIARDITREKREELAAAEAARRDPVTGFYKRGYGEELIRNKVPLLTAADNTEIALCVIRIGGFDSFAAYYGNVFGGIILMELGSELLSILNKNDIPVRLGSDELMILFSGGRDAAAAAARRASEKLGRLYTGENPELQLNIRAGAAFSHGGFTYGELLQGAHEALHTAMRADNAAAEDIDAGAVGVSAVSSGTDNGFINESAGGIYFAEPVSGRVYGENAIKRDKPSAAPSFISFRNPEEEIINIAFGLFEHTRDIKSVINLLLNILGRIYSLRQTVIYTYDADFNADRVAYQWNAAGQAPAGEHIERVTQDDLKIFETYLHGDGSLVYNCETAAGFPDSVRRLLCAGGYAGGYERMSAYCCAVYENGALTGRIIYISGDPKKIWDSSVTENLYEITKIIAANLSVERSNSASRAKSEFLSRISHEIRTPMNAIIGMTEIAKASMGDSSRVGDCLNKIDFSSKYLLALINDVLEMSRIESGKLNIENASFSMSGFIGGVELLMRPPIEGRGIILKINNNTRHDTIVGDEYRLRQVLINLLGNANKFTGSGGMITLTVDETGSGNGRAEYRFSVRDTGIGIARGDQVNIFRAFEQAKSGNNIQKRQGTGLGLAICSSIVSAMGGKIGLDSDIGRGSEFYFTLDFELAADTGREEQSSPADNGGETDYSNYFAGKRVLLVEDNEINIEIATYILRNAGFEIEVAMNGQEAVDKFSASAYGYYDLILMDIHMPVMDGLTATRLIRRNNRHPGARTVPIIAMTANAFDEDMKKTVESGMNGNISKPIDSAKMYDVLRRQLSGK